MKVEKQMRKFEVGRNARDGKPFNPIRVVIRCRKCEEESAELYRFNDRGFIKTRCSCGPDNLFSMDEFRLLPPPPCPGCHNKMEPTQLESGNACYYCKVCNGYYPFADLLPDKSK
jgi:hypothetical protein